MVGGAGVPVREGVPVGVLAGGGGTVGFPPLPAEPPPVEEGGAGAPAIVREFEQDVVSRWLDCDGL